MTFEFTGEEFERHVPHPREGELDEISITHLPAKCDLVLKAEQHDNFKASFFLESVEETARYILPSFCSWICYVFGLLRACLRFCIPKLKQSNLTSHTKTGGQDCHRKFGC